MAGRISTSPAPKLTISARPSISTWRSGATESPMSTILRRSKGKDMSKIKNLLIRYGFMVDPVAQLRKEQKEKFQKVENFFKKESRIDPHLGASANVSQWCAFDKLTEEGKTRLSDWLKGESWEFDSNVYPKKFVAEIRNKQAQKKKDSDGKTVFINSMEPDNYRYMVMRTFRKVYD